MVSVLSSTNTFILICSIKHSEENVTVDCEIRTLEIGDFSELSLAEECNLNKIVLNAALLVEVLRDIDNESDELDILLSPAPPHFRMTTNSVKVILKVFKYLYLSIFDILHL